LAGPRKGCVLAGSIPSAACSAGKP